VLISAAVLNEKVRPARRCCQPLGDRLMPHKVNRDVSTTSAMVAQLIPQDARANGSLLYAATPALSAGAISKLPVKPLL
jgi:hypothetical protein